MAPKMRWVTELPGPVHQPRRPHYQPRVDSEDLHAHAAQLRQHPLRWAEFPRPSPHQRLAKALQTRIAEGGLAAYHPDKGFEVARRGAQIYVRYNPQMISPLLTAYQDGFKAGVSETVERFRAGVWELRQVIADVERDAP